MEVCLLTLKESQYRNEGPHVGLEDRRMLWHM